MKLVDVDEEFVAITARPQKFSRPKMIEREIPTMIKIRISKSNYIHYYSD